MGLIDTDRFFICILRSSLLITVLIFSATIFADPVSNPRDSFSTLLKAHVNDGFVNYQGFLNNDKFDEYIDYISKKVIAEDLSKKEKLAFYINAYNALSIKGILNGYSPKSFFGKVKFFYSQKYIVAGESINLYDLEHEIVRPFGEPRIHFALVCSAVSCPKLRSEAYEPEKLDAQLTDSAIDFINDIEKNEFNVDREKAYLSKIFSWFEEDFTKNYSLQYFIAQYVRDPEAKALLKKGEAKIKYKKYNWSLNGKK